MTMKWEFIDETTSEIILSNLPHGSWAIRNAGTPKELLVLRLLSVSGTKYIGFDRSGNLTTWSTHLDVPSGVFRQVDISITAKLRGK